MSFKTGALKYIKMRGLEDTKQTSIASLFKDITVTKPGEPKEVIVETPKSEYKIEKSDDKMEKLIAKLGYRESRNKYDAVNSYGYIGKYQQGALMLADLGYVRKGTKNSGLRDPRNWKKGMSMEKFLKDEKLQEELIRKELVLNKRYLGNSIRDEKDLYGMLSAAHLLGAGGAKKRGGKDAFGASFDEYYKMGLSVFG